MFPIERSLVEKHKDQPFALIGVNSDPKAAALRGRERDNVTWRSFWDGPTTQGPIASKWNAQGWPTLYLLDAKGVIRHKSIGPMASMERKVGELLAETGRSADANK